MVGWLYIEAAFGSPNAHFNLRFGTCAALMPAAFADWNRAFVASALHPFHDGNGRTGRVINILMLMEAGLLQEPILYLSRSIIARKNDYYRLLRSVTGSGAAPLRRPSKSEDESATASVPPCSLPNRRMVPEAPASNPSLAMPASTRR